MYAFSYRQLVSGLFAVALGSVFVRGMASEQSESCPRGGCHGAPPAPDSVLLVAGDASIMAPKAHGTSRAPVQENLRWRCDRKLADRICNFNRHYAENSGYFSSTAFLTEESAASGEITFFDSNTGMPLFVAPRNRTWAAFVSESTKHGWPSFREHEVVWEHVRVLPDGECVSTAGTHLGHNLPDKKGNRFCINLVSVAGRPAS